MRNARLEATYNKPEGSRWTDEQWAAIAAGGTNILVAAAAGSGKTAVLVERIISRIADERRPLDVDSLLVTTFTKAAAAEMKERIRLALEEALDRDPESEHLRRQLALLPRASITTLHSFCMEVIEKYAPLIGLDPGFRIANETEAELLRMDTLDALFEERYESEGENGPLARLADQYGGERSDEPLHGLVLELHEFARSHPWPEWWLRETAAGFRVSGAEELASSVWAASMRQAVEQALEGALALLASGREIADGPAGPAPYAETLASDMDAVAGALRAVRGLPWESWNAAFAAISFGRLKPCRGESYDPELQERVKGLRDEAKKTVAKLAEEWFVRTPEQYAEELNAIAPDMAELAEIVIAFGERYEEAKREQGLLDFGDLEHYALRVLRDESSSPERTIPSAAALDYRERFAEILLDEYQDTNEVQEAIVSLIAKESPGNVFMVGDVKQSIYRFRLAEPGLFLAKYKNYDVWTPRREDLHAVLPEMPETVESAESAAALEAPEAADSAERARAAATVVLGEGDSEEAAAGGIRPALRGLRIDLARNFRSRTRVVDAVNHVFRLIMREKVGEMDYDRRAELIYGEGYPADEETDGSPGSPHSVEMILLQSHGQVGAGEASEEEAPEGAAADPEREAGIPEEELETVQLEARCIASEIKRLMGHSGEKPFTVYDGKNKLYRPLAYRDIVILLRAATSLSPAMLDELKAAGIPAYADLATGYFAATEVDVMLSLLQVIDNPDQDIPLAGVLRSPIVGLSAELLAKIRIQDRRGTFYEAVRAAASESPEAELAERLTDFLASVDRWRSFARREALAELLWLLYRETGYYDFVGGLPGGVQRQANLRALIDRARQFETSSSSRGLFRFLRFLGRMRDTGADLGAARALGEQEDVVRIVSIHKSKGLEFPVVFVAGLGRSFNKQDLNGLFLKHKKLGFGPKRVEAETRVAYPTFPQLAIRRRLKAEMLAEEMRVLYVALTRPKEKLILIGTTKDADKELNRWRELANSSENGLPDYAVASANRYLDWVGPAATLAARSWKLPGDDRGEDGETAGPTGWHCRVVPAAAYMRAPEPPPTPDTGEQSAWNLVLELKPVPVPASEAGERAYEALSWVDPHREATQLAAKTSITALKRQLLEYDRPGSAAEAAEQSLSEQDESEELRLNAGEDLPAVSLTYRLRRPKFLGNRSLTPAERGSVVHLVLQHLPLKPGTDASDIERLLELLIERRIVTDEQRRAVDPSMIAAFCRTPLYERMCRAGKLWREVPFSYGLPAPSAYPAAGSGIEEDTVLIQGVIDCLFPEEDGLVLIDYKTDNVWNGAWEEAAEKHRFQIERYAEAIAAILGRPVKEGYVVFVDGGECVRLL
ncbi:UvrD-helicase domain-containing protein [Cohnella thailandensis]|uniref:ATP-dependent helicase/nuclease subunit A n=1 Tax=Cohnella thailandensis TaxID=557557 RepID=A0A841SZC0_9BACL|nr:UvrD-helicase domain-containing protein [Cohnella thailandensis]MBB6636219.1 UvrD-helicase domain-containing protein [Cohnella thailandensis]MBP1973812.1 ATP-dependent helicase/nuclease subunit A [Cohnella thailandensis]